MFKKLTFAFVLLLLVAQIFRPERNSGTVVGPNFVGTRHPLPVATAQILERACYDCHSNYTQYPWYANVQPVGWWLAWHVKDGKRHLNFSEFTTYNDKRAGRKLQEVSDEVREGGMPLTSYTLAHPKARLTPAEKKLVTDWADAAARTYPAVPHKD